MNYYIKRKEVLDFLEYLLKNEGLGIQARKDLEHAKKVWEES